MIERETTETGLQRSSRQRLVRRGGTRAQLGIPNPFDLPETTTAEAHHNPFDTPIPYQQIRSLTDHHHRHVRRNGREKRRKIILVRWREHQVRRATNLKPCHLRHGRIECQPPANASERIAKPFL